MKSITVIQVAAKKDGKKSERRRKKRQKLRTHKKNRTEYIERRYVCDIATKI